MHPNIDDFLRDETLEPGLRNELGDVLYDELRELAERDVGQMPRTHSRSVFILPNFMGSKLARSHLPLDDAIWIDPGDIAQGGTAKLALDAHHGTIEAPDVLWCAYARMRARLRQAHLNAEFLPYDWRLSSHSNGESALRQLRRRGVTEAVIIAHGAGGLVARRMAELDPHGKTIAQVVTIAAPNHGCYAPVEMLRLTHTAVQKLGKLDRLHTAVTFATDVLRHLPGLLELIPSPTQRTVDFFQPSAWPRDGVRPHDTALAAAAARRAALGNVDDRFTQIIGIGQSTRVDAKAGRDGVTFVDSLDGDGTVPRTLAEMGDGARYYVDCEHSAMCNNVSIINACISIIERGTAPLPQRPPLIEAAPVDVHESALRTRAEAVANAMPANPPVRDDLLDGFVSGAASPSFDLLPQPVTHRHAHHRQTAPADIAPAPEPIRPDVHAAETVSRVTPPDINATKLASSIDALMEAALAATDLSDVVRFATKRDHIDSAAGPAFRSDATAGLVQAWRAIDSLLREIGEPDDPDLIDTRTNYSTWRRNADDGRTGGDDFCALARGISAGRAVARLRLSDGSLGTGFLVGPNLILTAREVIADRSAVSGGWASFCYELADSGFPRCPKHFALTDDVFLTSPKLGYTFVSLEPVNSDGTKLSEFGQLSLLPRPGKVLKREPVTVIEHPGGQYKSISLRENVVIGRVDAHLYYTARAALRAAGAPVMNSEWQVAALHQCAIPHPDRHARDIAHCGTRISRIVADVEHASRANVADAVAVEAALQRGREEAGEYAVTRPLGLDAPPPRPMLPASLHAQTPPLWSAQDARAVVSERGLAVLVGHELGSVAYYTQVLDEAPSWPSATSGVTIGVRYDLAAHTIREFACDWRAHLSASDYNRLAQAIGFVGEAARQKTAELADIRIPLRVATEVFETATLPKHVALTYHALPRPALDELHPHCVSALVSLTANRGANFGTPGDRYREMRNIFAHLESRRYARIAPELRSMKRLWSMTDLGGLLRRREDEAALFEAGLRAMHSGPQPLVQPLDADPWLEQVDQIGDVVSASAQPSTPETLQTAFWPSNHRNAPDTWHLPAVPPGAAFELTADLIERFIALNAFAPETASHGKLILGLRGCAVQQGEAVEGALAARLIVATPEHHAFRCLIGVFDTHARSVSLYPASTVPSHLNMRNYSLGKDRCNMLPTGCYRYCVGTHYGIAGALTYVLRQGDGPEPEDASHVTVVRSTTSLSYSVRDTWDKTRPANNIHPGLLDNAFASAGSLTVKGSQAPDRAWSTGSGHWAAFRAAAGFDGKQWGEPYDLVLVTGHELATLAHAPSPENYTCLRQGSHGERVKTLQRDLGITADGIFGPTTAHALARRQIQSLGFATGTWSPAMASTLGLSFVPAPHTASHPPSM